MGQPIDPTSASQDAAGDQEALEESLLGSFEHKARRRTRIPLLVSMGTAVVTAAVGLVGNILADSVDLARLGFWRWAPLGIVLAVYASTILWRRPTGRPIKLHDIANDAADDVWSELSFERRDGVQYRGNW